MNAERMGAEEPLKSDLGIGGECLRRVYPGDVFDLNQVGDVCVEQRCLTKDGKGLPLVVAHRRDGDDGSTQQHLAAVVGVLPPCVRGSRTDPYLFLGRASDLDEGRLVRLLVFLLGVSFHVDRSFLWCLFYGWGR